jgi:hypothetical protein
MWGYSSATNPLPGAQRSSFWFHQFRETRRFWIWVRELRRLAPKPLPFRTIGHHDLKSAHSIPSGCQKPFRNDFDTQSGVLGQDKSSKIVPYFPFVSAQFPPPPSGWFMMTWIHPGFSLQRILCFCEEFRDTMFREVTPPCISVLLSGLCPRHTSPCSFPAGTAAPRPGS